LETFLKSHSHTEFQHGQTYSYKHTQFKVFSASIVSESMSEEAMAASKYVMNKIWAEMDCSIDKALLRRFENQQFNWVQADPVYRG